MSFDRPLLLLMLLVLPVVAGGWWWLERRPVRYTVHFTNLEVLTAVAGGRARRRYVAPVLFLLALASASVALARPQLPRLVPVDRATVILVIDISGSMRAGDVKPSRLGAAQAAARAFLARTPRQLRVGLIAFDGEPQVAAPPTTDHALVRASIDSLGVGGTTAIGDALAAAVQLGRQAVAGKRASVGAANPNGRRDDLRGLVSILLLSDGSQTMGRLQPLQGAQQARQARIPVYTIALGTANGQLTLGDEQFRIPPTDPTTLRTIARLTGGQFTNATNATILTHAYTTLGTRLGRTPGRSEITFAFLAAAAGLLLSAGTLSTLWSPRLP